MVQKASSPWDFDCDDQVKNPLGWCITHFGWRLPLWSSFCLYLPEVRDQAWWKQVVDLLYKRLEKLVRNHVEIHIHSLQQQHQDNWCLWYATNSLYRSRKSSNRDSKIDAVTMAEASRRMNLLFHEQHLSSSWWSQIPIACYWGHVGPQKA